MHILESLFVALSTYSQIPVPQFQWNERNVKYSICFFPAVGLFCGAALLLWNQLCLHFGVSAVLFAAAASCLPLLISGGIHMDGFMDTIDALSSHQSKERKLEIMKDPNCGAFAVIYCAIYLLLQFGLFHELYLKSAVDFYAPVFILSRALSAFCAVNLPNARKNGMLCAVTQNTDRKKASFASLLTAVFVCVLLLSISLKIGSCISVMAAATVLMYQRLTMKEFGGVTGDTSGFFLQLCELLCLFATLIGACL